VNATQSGGPGQKQAAAAGPSKAMARRGRQVVDDSDDEM
jgi:hypothetical protein